MTDPSIVHMTWSWTASTDSSGIKEYEVILKDSLGHQVTHDTTLTPSYTVPSSLALSEGNT